MDSEQPVCPACGQPVEMEIRRHKTLGAWVPVWVRGPCRNPKCEAFPGHEAGRDDARAEEAGSAPAPRETEDSGRTKR